MPQELMLSRFVARLVRRLRPGPATGWLSLIAAAGVAAVIGASTAAAEPAPDLTGRWGIGLEGGWQKLVEGEWDYSTANRYTGLSLEQGLSRQWSISAALRFGYVRPGAAEPGDEVGLSGTSRAPLATSLLQPNLSLRHRFAPTARLTPFAGVGLGLTRWKVIDLAGDEPGWFPTGAAVTGLDIDGQTGTLAGTNLTILLELGLDFAISEAITVKMGARYGVMAGNDLDNIGLANAWGPDHVDANTGQVAAFVGVTWWLGVGDRDRDGVPNGRDQCPDEAEDHDGWNDTDGCPDPDNDLDGIPDAEDACPNRAEDPDGFEDEDGCPDPDNDRDGIPDGRDECPNEAEDIDGWDDRDGCPDPDNDLDGVPDTDDECPRTPAGTAVDERGCPTQAAPPRAALAPLTPPPAPAAALAPGDVLQGVTFVSGSAELEPASIAVLVAVAATLRDDPSPRIEIHGHTDAVGDPQANRLLSQRRAESVRASLIQLGIEASRLVAIGQGDGTPVADNGTADGRALNRRVEIHRR